jgi:hypothetical protein
VLTDWDDACLAVEPFSDSTAPPLFTFLINFNKKTHILGETAPSADYEIIVFVHKNMEKYTDDQSNKTARNC